LLSRGGEDEREEVGEDEYEDDARMSDIYAIMRRDDLHVVIEDDDFDADSMNEIDVGEEEDAEEEISMRM